MIVLRYLWIQVPQVLYFVPRQKGAPTKAMFLFSCVFVVMMLPGRAAGAYQFEDVMGVLAILFTAPYFLFFCRSVNI